MTQWMSRVRNFYMSKKSLTNWLKTRLKQLRNKQMKNKFKKLNFKLMKLKRKLNQKQAKN